MREVVGVERAVVLVIDDVEIPVWHLDARRQVDFSVLDAICRLQLAAKRMGWQIRLQNPCGEMLLLLRFAGLDAALGVGSGVGEAGREAEGLEELRVQEVVQPGDAAV